MSAPFAPSVIVDPLLGQVLTRNDVFLRVRNSILAHLGTEADPATIAETSSLADDLGADSLDTVEIAMLLEEDWTIEIADAPWETVTTLGQCVDAVIAALAADGRPIAGEAG